MPPLILLTIAGLGAYAGCRAARSILQRLETGAGRQDSVDHDTQSPRDLGFLERDPESGVYRPRK